MRYANTFVLALVIGTGAIRAVAESVGTVAVVNAPLAYIAEVLGSDALEIVFPVPSDVDPAYWSPGPEQVRLYQQADLILLNGAGYANWTETEMLPRARLVDTTSAVREQLISAEADGTLHKHGPEGEHAHDGAFAITTWLAPALARAQVDAAAEAIARRWPDLASNVEEGRLSLHHEIDEMDAAFEEFFERNSRRQIFVSHPVYQYLDRAYAGDFISLHWEPDADPEQEEWIALESTLDPTAHPVMLWEDAPLAETAERLNAMDVEAIVLRPMANGPWSTELFRELGAQVGELTAVPNK